MTPSVSDTVSLKPWATACVNTGFFLWVVHKHIDLCEGRKPVYDICPICTHPLSPPLRNVDSSIIATQSRLPSTHFISVRPPLFPLSRSSSSKSAKPPPSNSSLAELRPPPRNTSCVSSTIFQKRTVLSLPPTLTAVSERSASRSRMQSWWPYSVST